MHPPRSTVLALIAFATAPLIAAASLPSNQGRQPSESQPGSTTIKIAGGECTIDDPDAQGPHWSDPLRGNTVLFKTRVRCSGDTIPIVRFNGRLLFSPEGLPGAPTNAPLRVVAESPPPGSPAQEEAVPPGDPKGKTFYTPIAGTQFVKGSGTYQGEAFAQVVAPQVSPQYHAFSVKRYVLTPP